MTAFDVRYDDRGVLRMKIGCRRLYGPRKHQVIRETLMAAGGKTRTRVRRALRQQMGTKRIGVINRNTRSYLSDGGRAYVIEGRGKGLPIEEFKGLRVLRRGVRAAPWNVARVFKRSFANGGFRARLTRRRFPVRRLYGPSIAKEIVKDDALDAFLETGPREVAMILPKKLARLIG